MVKNLLVELGLEEMPAYVVTPSMKQLRDKMGAFLTDHRLTFEKIENVLHTSSFGGARGWLGGQAV